LSELIQQTIADLRALRISEVEALKKIKEYREQAITRKSDDVPPTLSNKEEAIPFYRLVKATTALTEARCTAFALEADTIIKKYAIIDWAEKLDLVRKMNFYISEYLIDEEKMPIKTAEALAEQCVEVAKKRYRQ
jgi:type I restriction enzyme R subunit